MRGGEGKRMSLYGKSILTPEEKAGLLKNVLKVGSHSYFS